MIPTGKEARERLRQNLRVTSLDNTFENFDRIKGIEKTLAAFMELASGATHLKLLLNYGGVGNGKTYLCEATAIKLYQRGIFCRVVTLSDIVRILKSCMGKEPLDDFNQTFERYCSSSHLIIDDVGMGDSGSIWDFGQLEEIIRRRYFSQLFTVITTNLDIKFDKKYPNIPFIPERIVSRFRDPDVGMVVLNEGEDYRGLKGKPKRGEK